MFRYQLFDNIHFETKAESYYPSVALASMIARYSFIKYLEESYVNENEFDHKGYYGLLYKTLKEMVDEDFIKNSAFFELLLSYKVSIDEKIKRQIDEVLSKKDLKEEEKEKLVKVLEGRSIKSLVDISLCSFLHFPNFLK